MTDPPNTPVMAESELVAQLRRGDPRAFETLVRTYTASLLRTARRYLRAEEDARDAVQEAFIAAFRSIAKFEATAQVSTWLHRIVINASLMKLRTQRRHPEDDIELLLPRFREDGHQVEPSVAWSETADAMMQRAELSQVVRDSIDKLPETYRVVLMLRDIEEMSTEEAAEALGITANAVNTRLHRARQALRTLLDPYMRSVTS
jgi:RNA polymerase sigma-70 factor (ECF subfamily)